MYSVYRFTLIIFLAAFFCWVNPVFSQKFILQDAEFNQLKTASRTQGVAAADYNNDGLLDFFIVAADPYQEGQEHTWSKLFQNNGDGTFRDVTQEAGLFTTLSVAQRSDPLLGVRSGASWGDYDNDGFVDLFLSQEGFDILYRNLGDGTFEDVTSSTGVAGCGECNSVSGLWWDFDLDGDLDLYVTIFGGGNRMYVNNGEGIFVEQAEALGLHDSNHSWMALPIDLDEDGDLDLYVSNDNEPNAMYINEGGVFTNQAPQLGLDDPGNGMGISTSDFDNDGIFELYVTNIHTNRGNPFYVRSDLSESFENKAEALGIDNTEWGWDIAFFDADHDLDQDLAVATFGNTDYNYFFNNAKRGDERRFNDISVSSGIFMIGGSFGLESFDYDNDGDIDLLFSNSIREPFLFDNLTNESGSGRNWVQINLIGTDSNRDAFGAKVTLEVGGKRYVRLNHGAGVGRQSKKPIHFGLSDFETIEQLDVQWPNGEVESFTNLPVNQLIVITENESIETNDLAEFNKAERNYDFDLSKSIARIWNEEVLHAIRNDFARPTVHARNLHHISAAMFDVMAAYNFQFDHYLLGNTKGGFTCNYDASNNPITKTDEGLAKAMSYAAYRLIEHRFKNSPGNAIILDRINALMDELGYDVSRTSTDLDGSSANFGNFVAQCYINFGLQDGSNEIDGFANQFYQPVNAPLNLSNSGNPSMTDPNRWQPLTLEVFIDQSGNRISSNTPEFLSPEWGNVVPFSLTESDLDVYRKDGNEYKVFADPGPPPLLDEAGADEYKWGFALVVAWSSHLSPDDNVLWDISPRSMGNNTELPDSFEGFSSFYDFENGGDIGMGYDINPVTRLPYEENIVPRGDFSRILAEYWADGPDSETPPGHWFTLFNMVSDHPQLSKVLEGDEKTFTELEWDVFGYFILGGAMHDVAVAAWSVKGYYDYPRPISAIRYMAEKGQSSDPNLPSYHEEGIPLYDGFIELVGLGDDLAVGNPQNIGKIKLKAWKGPAYIEDEDTDVAGVGWILAEDWWPYQRPSFVTPPFAGYVSGHSTFSRAAAEVLTRLTGDPYFPGGLGEVVAKKSEFLVFEDGPSEDVVLQWATYQDASDQSSLSRIWGGIHPPADDIPGRKMGIQVGNQAFEFGKTYLNDIITSIAPNSSSETTLSVFPIPSNLGYVEVDVGDDRIQSIDMFDLNGKWHQLQVQLNDNTSKAKIKYKLQIGVYIIRIKTDNNIYSKKIIIN